LPERRGEELSYPYTGPIRPLVACGLGVLVAAASFLVLALIGGDSAAAVEYQWGMAGYTETPAQVVETYVQHHTKNPDAWKVVLAAEGARQTIEVQHQPLFNDLTAGQTVHERLVMNRVVAVRAGGQVLAIDDYLAWLLGLPGGILLGLMLLILGVRAGLAKGFNKSTAMRSYLASTAGRPEGVLFVACLAFFFSGVSIGVIEQFTAATPPFGVVAFVLAAFTVVGAALSVRMVRRRYRTDR
jgi:hypothetical protein